MRKSRILLTFPRVFQTEELAQGLHKEQKESPSMIRTVLKPGRRQRRVSWGVLLSLVGYFLNLCTLSPLVHAGTFYPSGPGQSAIPNHCKRPPSAMLPSSRATADHETTPEPVCCEMRGGQNKALASSFAHTDFLPLLVCFVVPFDATMLVARAPSLYEISALYSSRPPPLYLVHATFLI